jgi:hypothetical protein
MDGDEVVKTVKKRIVSPGEMEKVKFTANNIKSCAVKIEGEANG